MKKRVPFVILVMSEIKPLHLWCGCNSIALISEHPKNKCRSQTTSFKGWLALIFLMSIMLVSFISAAEIKFYNPVFQPGETLQAQISGNFTQLSVNNLFFYKLVDKEEKVTIHPTLISKNNYYLFAILPESPGKYKLKIENAMYHDSSSKLSSSPLEAEFTIEENPSSFYKELANKAKIWPENIEDNSLSLLALSYNPSLKQLGTSALLLKSDNKKCFPKTNCNIYDTSIALFTLSKINASEKEKIKNWLLSAENNLDLGAWSLVVSSGEERICQASIGNKTMNLSLTKGEKIFLLDLKNQPEQLAITLPCGYVAEAKLINTYGENTNEFQLIKQLGTHYITLNNKKCFGTNFRTECRQEETAMALLALNSTGVQGDLSFLQNSSLTLKQKAILYYLSGDKSLESDIISPIDIESAIYSYMALKKYNINNSLGEYLKNHIGENIETDSLILYSLYPTNEIKEILQFSPGFILTTGNFSLTLKNRGLLQIIADLNMENNKQTIKLEADETKQIYFTTAKDSDLKISSANEYNIPVFYYLSDQQIPSISGNLQFNQTMVNLTIIKGEETSIKIKLSNSGTQLKNITFSYPAKFYNLMTIFPEIISLNSFESKEITLSFKTEKSVSGELKAESENLSASIILNIIVKDKTTGKVDNTTKTTKSSGINKTVFTLALIVIATLIIFYFLRKFKKVKSASMQDVFKKAEKK